MERLTVSFTLCIFLLDLPKTQLLEYKGIVTVSGDGLPHEVVNGLNAREDKDDVFSKISLGVLPAGSANALMHSIMAGCGEKGSMISAAMLISKGEVKNIDLFEIQTKERPPVVSFLSVAWAYIAEVDLNSEGMR